MVDHLPNLGREAEMLHSMGLESIEDLFSDIPEDIKRVEPLDLPLPQTEEEIWADAQRLLGANIAMNSRPNFLGAGLYQNFVPTMVPMMATRGEFLTAYTPYQPEVSQGILQAIYEYQSLVSQLFQMDATNAGMYDGASALAEAALMACRQTKRNRVAVRKSISPLLREVLETYLNDGYQGFEDFVTSLFGRSIVARDVCGSRFVWSGHCGSGRAKSWNSTKFWWPWSRNIFLSQGVCSSNAEPYSWTYV